MKSKTQFTVKPLVTAILLLAFSTASAAIRLGEPVVISKIGEPFKVEIPVIDANPAMFSSLNIKIANSKAYADAQVNEPTWINTANIELRHGDGYPKVIVSAGPQTESIVDLIFEVRSIEGTSLQAIPVVLDPQEGVYQITPISLGMHSKKSSQTFSIEKNQLRAQRDVDIDAGNKDIKVKTGDNLSALVRNMVTKETSLDQLLVAYTKANPQAFVRGNMNKLKSGVVLKAPSKSDIQEIGQREAQQIVAMQSTNFAKYTGAVAALTENARPQNEYQASRTARGKIQAKVNEPSQIASSQDKLRLSAASKKDQDVTQGNAKNGTLTEEEKIAQKIQIEEAHRRIAELEEVIAAHQKLVELENSAMAQAQNSAQINKDLSKGSPSVKVPVKNESDESNAANNYQLKPIMAGALLGVIALVIWTRRRKYIDDSIHPSSNFKAEYPMQTSAYAQPLEEQSTSTVFLTKVEPGNQDSAVFHTMAEGAFQDTGASLSNDVVNVAEAVLQPIVPTIDIVEPVQIPEGDTYTSMLSDIPELNIVFTQETQAEDDVFVFDATTLSIESVVKGSDFDLLNASSNTMLSPNTNSSNIEVIDNVSEVMEGLTNTTDDSTIKMAEGGDEDSVPLNFLDSNMSSASSPEFEVEQNVAVQFTNQTTPLDEVSTVTVQAESAVPNDTGSTEATPPRSSKLALAKLHLQLGDISDAREVLMEMYVSGTSEEKKVAMEILAKLDQQA